MISRAIREKLACYIDGRSLSGSSLFNLAGRDFDFQADDFAATGTLPTKSAGLFGDALNFDGTDRVRTESIIFSRTQSAVLNVVPRGQTAMGSDSATVFAWVRIPSGVYTSGTVAFAAYRGTTNPIVMAVRFFSGTDARFNLILTGETEVESFLGPTINLDQWHFVAVRYDSTSGVASFFVDATKTDMAGVAGEGIKYTGEGYCHLGGGYAGSNLFSSTQCDINQFGHSSEVLTDAEILSIYNSGAGAMITPLPLGVAIETSALSESSATLKAVVTGGLPGYSFQWAKDGVDLAGETSSVLTDAIGANVADYSVTVTDSASSTASSSINVDNDAAFSTVTADDSKLLYTPLNWFAESTSQSTVNCGAYVRIKCDVPDTELGQLNVVLDTSGYSVITADDETPVAAYRIDGGPWTRVQLGKNPAEELTLALDLSAGIHNVDFGLSALGDKQTMDERWDTPVNKLKLDSLKFRGLTIEQADAIPTVLIFGDSISEGVEVFWQQGHGTQPFGPSLDSDAFSSWSFMTADKLALMPSIVAFSAQGYGTGGYGGVPTFPLAWDSVVNGVSRLTNSSFTVQPDQIWVNHGTNPGASEASVSSMLVSLRGAAPDAPIVQIVPFGQDSATEVTAGFNAFNDDNKKLVDLENDLISSGSHPLNRESLSITDLLVPQLRTNTGSSGGTSDNTEVLAAIADLDADLVAAVGTLQGNQTSMALALSTINSATGSTNTDVGYIRQEIDKVPRVGSPKGITITDDVGSNTATVSHTEPA